MSVGTRELVRGWVRSAQDPSVTAALNAVYAEVANEVARRAPSCWASGRCCNFKKTGHLLYVTGLEAVHTLVRCGSPGRARLAESLTTGGCPFQVMNLCGVHGDKPLGCRLYFCDRTAQQWQNEVYERLLGALRAVHTQHAVEYRYGEWRSMLGSVLEHAEEELKVWTGGDLGTHHEDEGGGGGRTGGWAGTRLTVDGK